MSKSDKGASPSYQYIYTKSIPALWMAEALGMLFEHPTEPYGVGEIARIIEEEMRTNGRIVTGHIIHPDSLHLLEPRIGDFIHSRFYGTIRCIWDEGEKAVVKAAFDAGYRDSIIQRNGKPFFWPESEAI
jgi:hypothetical protein